MGFSFRSTVDVNKVSGKLFDTTIAVGYSDEMHHSGFTAASLGRRMEEGNDITPPRPHLNEGLEFGMSEIREAIREHARGIFGSRKQGAAEKVAEVARQSILDYVYSGALPPNAEYTVSKKHSDQPLVETGELLHLLEAVVIKGKI